MIDRKDIMRKEFTAQIMAAVSHEDLAFAAYDYLMHTGWTPGSRCGTVTKLSAGIFDEPIGLVIIDELTIPF